MENQSAQNNILVVITANFHKKTVLFYFILPLLPVILLKKLNIYKIKQLEFDRNVVLF